MKSWAKFSPCRTYRYSLMRLWDKEKPYMIFIGLNPSTADETSDDPTIRRVIGFAKRESCGGIVMLNLFAFRATNPKDMMQAVDPIGPENDAAILGSAAGSGLIVAGWGVGGAFKARGVEVRDMIAHRPVFALKLAKNGEPCHPLYLRGDQALVPFDIKRQAVARGVEVREAE